MTDRRSFSDMFKATVAFEALRGDKTAQGAGMAAVEHIGPQLLCRGLNEAIAKYGKPDIIISITSSPDGYGTRSNRRPYTCMNCRTGAKPNA